MISIVFASLLIAGLVAFDLLRRHSRFPHRPGPPRPFARHPRGTVETVHFPAFDGTRLEGWLFRPLGPAAPLVVMAPGLGGTKDGFLEPYAWKFVEHGIAALVFDYRCFGGSEGTPRHWVDPTRHMDDYRAALRFARDELGREVIDPDRIALWGSSFSGGSALVVASTDERVNAVVVQGPFLETPQEIEPTGLRLLRFVAYATLDLMRIFPPIYIPIFGRPGEWVFAPSVENPSVHDFEGPLGADFWRLLPQPPLGGWQNRMLARVLPTLESFRPMDAVSRVRCPILFIAAAEDDLVPCAFVTRARDLATSSDARLEVLPGGHFDLYVGPESGKNAEMQARFLAERL